MSKSRKNKGDQNSFLKGLKWCVKWVIILQFLPISLPIFIGKSKLKKPLKITILILYSVFIISVILSDETKKTIKAAISQTVSIGLLAVIALALSAVLIYVITRLYAFIFFHGKKFNSLKESIQKYINDCNDLNEHIEELRSSFVDIKKIDYGEASYQNVGAHNYKRKEITSAKYAPNICDCSREVCDNARKQPFKYVCKYFNIGENKKTLEQFEEVLNNFSAADEGKILLQNKRAEILGNIANGIPTLVRKLFPQKLEKELGFDEFEFDELFYPVFSFRYISPGGNSGAQFDVTMDMEMLERFVTYLSEKVKFQDSAAGQRRLMTPKLRRYIIERDGCTCKQCGNSTYNEPNLLLEVDHIIPVAKGGMTTEENLQTLCWKCNRHKGSRITVRASCAY